MKRKMWLCGLLLAALLLASACGDSRRTAGGDSSGGSQSAGAAAGGQPAGETPATTDDKPMSFDQPPEMHIDESKTYTAVVRTSAGEFTVELYAKDAPIAVNSFIFLAKQGYFDGVVFHRVVPDYIIQTGDPTATGRGGPGYRFQDELDSPHRYGPGIVAMANAGPNTNGSQFFICTGEMSERLNEIPDYTIFGKVTDGMDVVLAIGATPVDGDKPKETIAIASIAITES